MREIDPDERLVDELRSLVGRVDPVPGVVTQAARAALGWRRLDADLAELLGDSAVETDMLVGARGAGGPARSVSFRAGGLTIDLEIHVDGAERTLLGQVSPGSAAGEVEIQMLDGGAGLRASTDGLGRFRARIPGERSIRLRMPAGSVPGSARAVETSWIAI
ncbi:MAG TPA: hypothetical protein VG165_00785 [Solirubrobacteraceae bacterium]|jgi:hypothetical protein|nr:hypothetical protein [Solirubrobacteraceae bacterium]